MKLNVTLAPAENEFATILKTKTNKINP